MAHGGDNTGSDGAKRIIILLIGETGSGKSTLGNALLGCKAPFKDAPFATSSSAISKTAYMQKVDGDFLGKPDYPICVIDCPGFADSEGRDDRFAHQLSAMMDTVGHLDVLLWCQNSQSPRFDQNDKKQLRACKEIFGVHLFANIVMNLSRWGHDKRSETMRKNQEQSFEKTREEIRKIVTGEIAAGNQTIFPIYTLDAMHFNEEEENKTFSDIADQMLNIFIALSRKPAFTKKAMEEYEARKKAEEAAGRIPTIDPEKERYAKYSDLPSWARFLDQVFLTIPSSLAAMSEGKIPPFVEMVLHLGK